ncbi:cofactor-independent phosphoglycerate mutase [bacterium]|nr:cofactor-independent phosphoglycerate mutase [candidate division CSSED10-310 bacterium]
MKYIVILGDGMADYPVAELQGKTPLMTANKPTMDWIARHGRCGVLQTIEPDMPTGSAVANLAVLGYDPRETFQGRGVLEAASLGVELADDDMAMRVNLICTENGAIRSHSAGHISNEEASVLIKSLAEYFHDRPVRLYQGLSYRHLLVVPKGDPRLKCAPPHDHVGRPVGELMVRPLVPEAADTAGLLNGVIEDSGQILSAHPVNRKRIEAGKQPANLLWPWSPGRKPAMKTFQERFGIRGAAISAVDLIKGLAIYAGMDVIDVEGATGLFDTNFEGKADACLEALKDHDFVYVHVEAADEAGHDRNLQLKIQCIEDLDRRLIRRIMNGLQQRKMEAVVAVLPDHPTPVALGSHVRDPVPVAIYFPGKSPDDVVRFDEVSVKSGCLGFMKQAEFIETVFGRRMP